jgi:hypothetical protein
MADASTGILRQFLLQPHDSGKLHLICGVFFQQLPFLSRESYLRMRSGAVRAGQFITAPVSSLRIFFFLARQAAKVRRKLISDVK